MLCLHTAIRNALFLSLSINPITADEKPLYIASETIIVFDHGSVLHKTDKVSIYQFMSEEMEVSLADAQEIYSRLKKHLKSGGNEESFWKDYSKKNQHSFSQQWIAEFEAVRYQAIRDVPGMEALVSNLRSRGFQTAILSNVHKAQANRIKEHGMYDGFEPVLLSCDLGLRKPDPDIFKHLLNSIGAKFQNCIFIDNKMTNIEAARELGIEGIVFSSAGHLSRELQNRGIVL
ncbi:MAG: putative hydrolase of the HAD superfamily [Chlamydiales bacterium]|jgi:putative hydrolase of the HAD superfamily